MISVIIPVYNVEKYLEKCLNSIVNQTLDNIEIILVEDCSTDKSLEICKRYSYKYDNIKLIQHEVNKGLSAARNTGLEYASGKYIGFIDSDDWVDKYMFEKLYKHIQDNDADIAICGIMSILKNGEKIKSKMPQNEVLYTQEEILNNFFDSNISAHAWDKLYKKELFVNNNIRYPEGKYYEDVYPTYKLLSKSKKVVIIKEYFYNYNRRDESITTSEFSEKNLDALEQLDNIKKDMISNNIYDSYKYGYESRYARNLMDNLIIKLIKNKSNFDINKFYKLKIKNNYKENTKYYIKNNKLSLKMKIKIFIIRNLFSIYSLLVKLKTSLN